MATNYPANVDNGTTLPNPTGVNTQNNPDHALLHSNANDAIKALEAKVGTGASTPVVNTFLFGTGTGTSAWTTATSAQIAAAVSDETGTGLLVFATTPTLVTPKVDTINESTPGNGVTVANLNIKSGVITSVSTAIGTNGVTAANLSTSAIKLGYASSTTAQVVNSTTATDVTNCSVTVTVPAGGRDVVVIGTVHFFSSGGSGPGILQVKESTTVIKNSQIWIGNTSGAFTAVLVARISAPSAGSHTYKLTGTLPSATSQFFADTSGYTNDILVEAI